MRSSPRGATTKREAAAWTTTLLGIDAARCGLTRAVDLGPRTSTWIPASQEAGELIQRPLRRDGVGVR